MFIKDEYLKKIDEVVKKGPFHDTWESLETYQVPNWYRNAKFGIFLHFGIYSVPAFGNEWYPRSMYMKETREYEHHIKTYGSQKEFGYKDFIPMFKAEKFNADEWAGIFEKAGAQYVVPVAEHHDGFQMYKSEISKWNAYEMGPKKNIVGDLTNAVKEHSMEIGVSSHRIEHWFFMGHGKDFDSDITEDLKEGDFYWPATPLDELENIYSEPIPTKEYLEDWLVRCCELVDLYQPKILYFDWWIQHSSAKPYLKKFAAYYYNRMLEWGHEGGVINYKHDAFMFGTAVVDIERGQFADIKPFIWQTDTAVAKNSWCYTENNDYKKAKDILCDLVDIVSKNGRLLLNVGPKADGTIPDEDQKILFEIGDWLKVNGEAIYNSKVWRVCGEGPTKIEEGQFTDGRDKIFTVEDIRYTVCGSSLYGIVLNQPEHSKVFFKELADKVEGKTPRFTGIIKSVEILGTDLKPEWVRTGAGLEVDGSFIKSDKPVVYKFNLD